MSHPHTITTNLLTNPGSIMGRNTTPYEAIVGACVHEQDMVVCIILLLHFMFVHICACT